MTKSQNVTQLEPANGKAAVNVISCMKEGNSDGAGALLQHTQGDAIWVTYLSQYEAAADSSALSTTIVLA